MQFDEELQIDADYMNLNPSKYGTTEEIGKELNHVYHLYAIIVHEGYSTANGHYYAYIKNQGTNIWYKYDDEEVKPIGKDLKSVQRSI